MVDEKRTLARSVTRSGIGLHTGHCIDVTLCPAPFGSGIVFVRVDLEGKPSIPALARCVTDTSRSTTLSYEGASVQTVEHLLAALFGLGVSDARIEVSGPELPILDGSALPYAVAVEEAGLTMLGDVTPRPVLETPLWIPQGNSFVSAIPSTDLRFSCGIQFESAAIGEQWYSFAQNPGRFTEELAPARTFVNISEIEALRDRGLIAGGSLDVALVCDNKNWLNGPLRFPNEPARHKLLDWMGDLSLLGDSLPRAHYIAFRAGHALHLKMATMIAGGVERLLGGTFY
jgi:UDP-3-O-[3-hydroxymyristoyl] N-acetylglucosamine deacetylase